MNVNHNQIVCECYACVRQAIFPFFQNIKRKIKSISIKLQLTENPTSNNVKIQISESESLYK